jgi:ankyrin repeat protein
VQIELVNVSDSDGETCLHTAVEIGNLEVVCALLLVGGAALAASSGEDSNTLLHTAVENENLLMMRVLLDVGGRSLLLRTNSMGRSCLHVSAARIRLRERGEKLAVHTLLLEQSFLKLPLVVGRPETLV